MTQIDTVPLLFLDFQTNGHSPHNHEITEIGWSILKGNEAKVSWSLIRIEGTIPKRVTKLTGVSQNDCDETGKNLQEVWQTILDSCPWPTIPCIVHYSRFEASFAKNLPHSEKLHFYCTHKMAKNLLPQLPSKSLRSVAGYLGFPIEELKRSEHHILATLHIWHHFKRLLFAQNIIHLSQLDTWLIHTKPSKEKAPKTFALSKEDRLAIPPKPGVYRMLNSRGETIYIGKAKNLRSRVNSYFRGQKSKGSRLNELISIIHQVKTEPLPTATHAAISEVQLIKKHKPFYNIAMKERSRQTYYLDQQFLPGLITDRHGPISGDSHFIDRLQDVIKALTEGNLINTYEYGPSEELILQASALFHAKYGYFNTRPELWRLVIRLHSDSITNKQSEQDSEPTGEDEFEDEPEGYTTETALLYMEKTLASLGYKLHRARWLKRIANSHLVWKESNQWHQIVIRQDNINWSHHPIQPVIKWQSQSQSTLWTDPQIYSVIKTEMQRLITETDDIFFYYHSGNPLDKSQILRHIFPELT